MTTAGSVLGLQVGSTGAAFLAVLAVHVPAGLAAVGSGATAALTRKGSRRHVSAGRVYVWAVRVVDVTAVMLAAMRWQADAYLAGLAMVCAASAEVGRRARRSGASARLVGDRPHLLGMGLSYVALLTAFYVDNGPHLPIWDRLPTLVFWTAPALIGGMLIARALHRLEPRRSSRPAPGGTATGPSRRQP